MMIMLVLGAVTAGGPEWDVVVYGATPAGLTAAFSACEAPIVGTNAPPLKVLVVEQTNAVGGMVTPGGIGLRDIGAQGNTVLGYTREWAVLNARHYNMSDTEPQWQVSLRASTGTKAHRPCGVRSVVCSPPSTPSTQCTRGTCCSNTLFTHSESFTGTPSPSPPPPRPKTQYY